MRVVLSVVAIFASLAIFGALVEGSITTKCNIKCANTIEDYEVCNNFGDFQITSSKCESDNLVKCAKSVEGKDVIVTDGACPLPTYDNCQIDCKKSVPFCAIVDGRISTHSNLCNLFDFIHCVRADAMVNNLTPPKVELVSYGTC